MDVAYTYAPRVLRVLGFRLCIGKEVTNHRDAIIDARSKAYKAARPGNRIIELCKNSELIVWDGTWRTGEL
jgi:hypothetical protein